jgi:glycosyltransferase involved in cell wall biosynthesis
LADSSSRSIARIPQTALRVAVLFHTSSISGPGRQLAGLISALEGPNLRFLVVLVQRRNRPITPYANYLDRFGIRHVLVQDSGRADPALVGRIAAVLDDFQPDIVETHGYKPSLIASLLRLRKPKWSWVAFWHGATTEDWKVRFYHRLDRLLMRRADHIVVMSEQQRAAFGQAGTSVSVIANAVLPMAETSAPLTLAAVPRPVLGVVGRLSSEKGVDVFIRTAQILRARSFEFAALIVGDGPERQALETLTNELGLGSQISFLGSRSDIDAVYRAIDLLVIPSRSEGLPNVLLEALAHDRPVVATEVGAIGTVIDSPLVGRLVPKESPGALADGIMGATALVKDPRAAAARRKAASRFSLSRRAELLNGLYFSLVSR